MARSFPATPCNSPREIASFQRVGITVTKTLLMEGECPMPLASRPGRVLILSGTSILLLAVLGCGESSPPLCQVSGKVVCQGKPLTVGEVTFMSDSGFGTSSPLDSEGRYSLRCQYGKGIPRGTYKVIVAPPLTQVVESAPAPTKSQARDAHPEIPQKYREFSTSGLEFVIKDSRHTIDLTLGK